MYGVLYVCYMTALLSKVFMLNIKLSNYYYFLFHNKHLFFSFLLISIEQMDKLRYKLENTVQEFPSELKRGLTGVTFINCPDKATSKLFVC